MKHLLSFILLVSVAAATAGASRFDLKDILNKSRTASQENTANASTSDTDNKSSKLGGILGSVLTELTSTSKIEITDLKGIWKYQAPAITFDSDNALQKIGGAAATASLEKKIAPYYQRAGITSLVLTIEEDSTFTMKMRMATVKGSVNKGENGKLIFNFQAFKKIKIGKVEAMASRSGETLSLTFDASKLQTLVEKIASISQNASIQSLSKILSSYDGIFVGCRMKRQSTSTGSKD